jgi:small basic protein (TIGR04137 family)
MSLDSSLRSKSALSRSRSVLTRAERLEVLKENERWDESKTVFGLPKVGQKKRRAKKEVKAEAGAEGAAAPAGKGAAKPAAGKGAAKK